ncbi:GNAT family N-acetyltransferase [Clostridium neuense]|uniref:GNAT family N-acetyltransferase n=1 Tax=Clostridium neuense TaxID=1728934 RepID=A0ABW8TJY2_9CLOT
MNNNYDLILLTSKYFNELYNWQIAETHFDYYTCRPVNLANSYNEYTNKLKKSMQCKKTYILINQDIFNIPLGKISLFNYNPRNHSAEFGYYMPEPNRNKGLGSIMLKLFIAKAFKDTTLNLNKLYATTSSNNLASINLLKKFNFRLDGQMREHYWIGENKYNQLIFSILKKEAKL